MVNKLSKPKEGQAYALELDDGRFALGVIARVDKTRPRRPYVIFVYFFGPFSRKHDLEKYLPRLKSSNYVTRIKTSALDIYDGLWLLIGELPDWKKDEWPFPEFYFQDDFTKKIFKRTLSEEDLVTCLQQVLISEASGLVEDSAFGSEAARQDASIAMLSLPSLI